jgi:outer membrane protein assembly factor BamE (lipoprotein component of BamABCDE complex)
MSKHMALVVAVLALVTPVRAEERRPVPAPEEREFTVGLVQKEVRVGMSQTDLVAALGSPNVVTRDGKGTEAWVYDRIASEARYASKGFGVGGGGSYAGESTLLLGWLSAHKRSEKATLTQRTLTVVVRFDGEGKVESFSFHASRF